jgi:APA family basic amino acid/polyamine antiporter
LQPVNADVKLARGLNLFDATMIVVGSMIGSGIFLVSAESARVVGAPGWLLVAWLLAGVMTITGALSVAELAAMMPKAGGPYVFLREAYARPVGFLYGWSQFLVIQTGTIAAVAIAFANFLGVFAPQQVSATNYLVAPIILGPIALSLSTQQFVAVLVIALLTAVNTRGLEAGKAVQNVLTVVKTGALLGLVVVGLWGWNASAAAFTAHWWDSPANGWSAEGVQAGVSAFGAFAFVMLLGKAMTGPLFSQSAWDNVTFAAGEIENPRRNLPRSLLLGCLIVVGLYLAANVAYIVTLSLDELRTAPNNRVAAVMMDKVLGSSGAGLMAAAVMISTFGCNNGLILSGARVSFAMARDGLWFAALGRTNARRVPATALVVQGLWASLLILPRTVTYADGKPPAFGDVYRQLLEYIVSVDLLFGAMSVFAVVVLRWRRPAADRPYRTWGYPVVPVVFLVLSIFVLAVLATFNPKTSGVGVLIALAGLPVYFLWSRRRNPDPMNP